MRVEFWKRADGGSLAIIDRGDGVRLQLRSYDRVGAVPHDAVHLIGERALGLEQGLWGSIAAGALFDSIEVVEGRLRHDRRQRSEEVRRQNAEHLRTAETVVGVLQSCIDCDGLTTKKRLDEAWGITSTGSSPFSPEQAGGAVDELRTLRAAWKVLVPGERGPVFAWPVATRAGRGRRR
ncbi:hypothetical protein [Pseudonocardia sp. GCM10023141]|uniref:hypothetical protein n=1 Tax=Pseudonocardia sp. GCM10023141 TaxID=3252653 RepID=UPI003621CBDA